MDIRLSDVTLKFGEFTALNSISAYFESGRTYGIIGRNGSGKTVMFKCILGMIDTYAGKIDIGGMDRRKRNARDAAIGMIIESPGFVSGYSGYDNLKFLADINHRIGKKEIIEAMELVGLDPKSKKHVEKYSLGMRQRLGIAQAVMEDPDILILDEPMNGLDNTGVRDLRAFIKKLQRRGKTILLASHNPLDISELCDFVYEMDAGVMNARDQNCGSGKNDSPDQP